MDELPIEFIDFAEFMADEARKISGLYYRGQLGVETKADNSPVTEADKKIEDTLAKLVKINFPEHGVYGEEFGQSGENSKYTWVIDPIDGTKSFISGRPLFGTLIALLEDGKPVIGLIDQPIINERWLGANGVTKFNNRQVNTRTSVKLHDAVFATTSPFLFSESGKMAVNRVTEASKFAVYGGDCYSYGQLAMGLVDVILESGLKPYDFCALVPIIENAGGVITNWYGNPLNVNNTEDILACGCKTLHQEILRML